VQLVEAAASGRVERVRELLAQGADVDERGDGNRTAVTAAALGEHVGVVRVLLDAGIPIDHVNNLGWTALLEAIVLSDGGPAHQEIVRLLVDAGADVAIADRDGVTPLQHARDRGYDEMVAALARE
jgi:ankyrin repeat protein